MTLYYTEATQVMRQMSIMPNKKTQSPPPTALRYSKALISLTQQENAAGMSSYRAKQDALLTIITNQKQNTTQTHRLGRNTNGTEISLRWL